MKHHNLYRLALIGYYGGSTLLTLMFMLGVIGILSGSDAAEGLAWFFGVIGALLTGGGATAHAFAVANHAELKPLPKEQRAAIQRRARDRRADLELEAALEADERRTRAIEGRLVECEVTGQGMHSPDPNLKLVEGRFVCIYHRHT